MSARYWVLISSELIRSGMDWPDGLRLTGPEWLKSCGIIPAAAFPGSNWYLVEDDDADPELEGQPVELTFRAESGRPVLASRHVMTTLRL